MLSCYFIFIDVGHRKVSVTHCHVVKPFTPQHPNRCDKIHLNMPEENTTNSTTDYSLHGMLHSVNQQIVTNVLKDFNAFNFRVKRSKNTAVTN